MTTPTRGQTPIGCQTVLVSTRASRRPRVGSASQSTGAAGARSTRFRLSAATTSSDAASSGSSTPARSSALMSMCDASHGAISAALPVRMLTTPPGRSEVAMHSDSVTAGTGYFSLAITTTVLPVTIAGAMTETRPSSGPLGATVATTPVGSGVDRLKNGPDTGLPLPSTWTYLSAQPAYQTTRSIAAST